MDGIVLVWCDTSQLFSIELLYLPDTWFIISEQPATVAAGLVTHLYGVR